MNHIFISPHDDDNALFGAFTCLREHPVLVVVFDGHVQQKRGLNITAEQRAKETELAADILECSRVVRLGFSDADALPPSPGEIRRALEAALPGTMLAHWYVPAVEQFGHDQHNAVGHLADGRGDLCTRYLTYTREGGKSTHGKQVEIEQPYWVTAKLQALSVYKSQMDPRTGCAPHFLREQYEYYL